MHALECQLFAHNVICLHTMSFVYTQYVVFASNLSKNFVSFDLASKNMDLLPQGSRVRIRKTFWFTPSAKRVCSKLSTFDVSQKVWVGGLTDDTTWKHVQKLADTVGKSKWVEILGKGQACVCYDTAEEAETAIATLNGGALIFDVWKKA